MHVFQWVMSVMREIEDYVLDSPIALTSAYDKVEKIRATLLGNTGSATLSAQTC